MQFSVIVAAFNADHFVGRAISSVQKQTIRDLEIIVVDDASTDNTHSVVQNLAENDNRIKLVRLTSNTGPSGARNIGFAAAKGEWIAVLDADEAFAPDRLERLIAAGHETGEKSSNTKKVGKASFKVGKPSPSRWSLAVDR